jgi:hypothetical protein
MLTLSALALSACSGTMTGLVAGTGELVTYNYKGMGNGSIRASMPSGEMFNGRFIKPVEKVNNSGIAFLGGNMLSQFNHSKGTTNNIEATLIGSKKHSMKCLFKVSNPDIGLPSGGNGQCEITDGRRVDVYFD